MKYTGPITRILKYLLTQRFTQLYFEEIRPWLHQRTAKDANSLPSLPVSATSRSTVKSATASSFRKDIGDAEKGALMRNQVEAAIDSKNKRVFMNDNIASDCHFDILKFIRTQLKASLLKQAKELAMLKSLTVFGNNINDVPVKVKAVRKSDAPTKDTKQTTTAATAPPLVISRPVLEVLKQPNSQEICDALLFYLLAMEKKRQKEKDEIADLLKREALETEKRKKEEERIMFEMEREEKKRVQKERLEIRKVEILAEAAAKIAAEKAAKKPVVVPHPFRTTKIAPKFWGRGLQTRHGSFHAHGSLGVNADLANANFLLKQPNNTLPMERVRLNPFGMYDELPSIFQDESSRVKVVQRDPMRRKFYLPDEISWLADELDTVLPKDELEYIRKGGVAEGGGESGFETRMKYFQF
jgi:hypothetical protein